jgi:competence ComEA-like helix-hairpin-helix protein
MAKVNANSATREELVEKAGLRPEIADAILKFRGRHGGRIADVDALGELPGIGPATLEQLRATLDFSDKGERAGDGSDGAARRTAEAVGEVQREALGGAAEGASELGRLFLDLVREQARQNLEVATALGRAFDWEEVARAQTEFVRASLERVNELNRRYLEVVQSMVAATTAAAPAVGERERDRGRSGRAA